MTCAHVVAKALNILPTSSSVPDEEVNFDFLLTNSANIVKAKVVFWLPTRSAESTQPDGNEDIAVLEITDGLPQGCNPAPLTTLNAQRGCECQTFGLPGGHDKGVPASGIIRGNINGGCQVLEDVKKVGYFAKRGFSGAPVWSGKAVIGMIVSANEANRAAYLIPSSLLISAISSKMLNLVSQITFANTEEYQKPSISKKGTTNHSSHIATTTQVDENEEKHSEEWKRPAYYIEREDLLNRCEAHISNNYITILRGQLGIGKTELAKQLMEAMSGRYKASALISLPEARDEYDKQYVYTQFLLKLNYFLKRNHYDKLDKALADEFGHVRHRVKVSKRKVYYLAELALAGLAQEGPYLLFIDNVEHTLIKGGSIAPQWKPFFDRLTQTSFKKTRVILVTSIEAKIRLNFDMIEEFPIPALTLEEARLFFCWFEEKYPSSERICNSDVFNAVYEKTEGNAAALMYIFAFHQNTGKNYIDILYEAEQDIVGSARSLKLENRSLNVRMLLERLFDTLEEDDYEALKRFSVYRTPVERAALSHLVSERCDEAAEALERAFLMRRRGTRYQLYPLAKDLAHRELREYSFSDYKRYHEKAALYCRRKMDRQAVDHYYEEAIYHFNEAGKFKLRNELMDKDPRLQKAELYLKNRSYLSAIEKYEEYVDYIGEKYCSSATLRNFAVCLEHVGLSSLKGRYIIDREGALKRATALYELANEGGDVVATGRLARLYLILQNQTGDSSYTETAISLYHNAINRRCDDREFYNSFYEFFYINEDTDNIKYTFEKALDNLFRFNKATFLHHVALFLKSCQNHKGAIEILEQGIASVPEYSSFYLAVASIYLEGLYPDKSFDKAVEVLERGVSNTSRNEHRYRGKVELELAHIYSENGDVDKTREWLRRGVEASPENIDIRLMLAQTCYKTKDYQSTIIHVNKALCGLQRSPGASQQDRIVGLLHKVYSQVAPVLMTYIKLWWGPRNSSPHISASALLAYLRGEQLHPHEPKQSEIDDTAELFLERFTTSDELNERLQSLSALRRFENIEPPTLDRIIPPLFNSLIVDDSVELKTSVMVTLALLKADHLIKVLAGFVQQDGERTEALHFPAIWSIGLLGSDESFPLLVAALHNRNPLVRFYAVEGLGRLKIQKSVEPLCKLYEQESDPGVQLAIIQVLAKHTSEDARDYVERIFNKSKNELTKLIAASALVRSNHPKATALIRTYVNKLHIERYACAVVMTVIEDAIVQGHDNLLGSIDQLLTFVLKTSFTRSYHDQTDNRSLGRGALLAACNKKKYLEYLITVIESYNTDARKSIANILGELEFELARPLLTQLLSDEERSVRETILESFIKLNRPESTPILVEHVRDREPLYTVREKIAEVVGLLGGTILDIGKRCEAENGACENVSKSGGRYCDKHKHLYVNVRIGDIARELGVNWRKVVEAASEEGIEVTHHLNSIPEDVADRIKKRIRADRDKSCDF
jgi:HEAT repeat protein